MHPALAEYQAEVENAATAELEHPKVFNSYTAMLPYWQYSGKRRVKENETVDIFTLHILYAEKLLCCLMLCADVFIFNSYTVIGEKGLFEI